ncbi:MAG: hypothetical protein JXB85_00200 [Anaerolineales bacterium]|nr:hypothetical protein [Anaerolineales bacterium]
MILLIAFALFLFFIMGGAFIGLSTFEKCGPRGLITYCLHWLIFLVGWLFGKWLGIYFLSLPLLLFYYYFLFHIALVVVPASEPGNFKEWFQRMAYFFWYTWGIHYPGWVVASSTARVAENRIKGSQFNPSTIPGLVWANSHQVVGLTTGISFSRIPAPGTVFTGAFESPFNGIVDLRTQLRTFWIDLVSSDGIPYKALLFTSFGVDRDRWDRGTINRLKREDRLLKDARELDCGEGSYPISTLRVRTLLSTTGIRTNDIGSAKSATTYWDELVMYQIEKAASEVLSQRRFDALWLPPDDHAGSSAADDIAGAIKDQCFFDLLCRGVRLFSCRLVNFEFSREKVQELGEVERQQIAAWQADWQRDTMEVRAQGKAEAELLRQEARSFAYANLLTAVAEGLQETQFPNPDLPRSVIAMRFIGALEEMLQQQPEGDEKSEATASMKTLRRFSPEGNL